MKKHLILIVVISILLEIFVFNYQSIKSLILCDEFECDKSIETQRFIDNDKNIVTRNYINLANINKKVYNIFIDFNVIHRRENHVEVEIKYTDQLFSGFKRGDGFKRSLTHKMTDRYERSKYIQCDLKGESNNIELIVSSFNDIKINNIIINKKIPFGFNCFRLIIVFMVMYGTYALFNMKALKRRFDIENTKQKVILIFISLLFILILFFIQSVIDSQQISEVNINKSYGINLLNSIKQWKVNLEVNNNVLNIVDNAKNPYDYSEMATILHKITDGKYFDVAYFNQRFYMYYGILPLLILLLPVNIITGSYMNMCLRYIHIFSNRISIFRIIVS